MIIVSKGINPALFSLPTMENLLLNIKNFMMFSKSSAPTLVSQAQR